MQTILNLFKKEFDHYMNSSVGYIVTVVFVILTNFLFLYDIFISGSASMRPFFNYLIITSTIFIPVIGMRSVAEELKNNTIEPLLSLPVSETQVILGKVIALIVLVLVAFSLTLPIPIYLIIVSGLPLLEVVSGYLGMVLMSAVMVTITVFFSSMTRSQVVALFASVTFITVVLLLDYMAGVLSKSLQDSLIIFSPYYYISLFSKGVIDLRAVIYFVGASVMFTFFAIINLEKRG